MTVPSLPTQCLVVRSRLPKDPVAEGLLADAHALNLKSVKKIERSDLYFIEGEVSDADRKRLCAELLADPVAQRGEWRDRRPKPPAGAHLVEVALRPGVTDPVAEQIVRCAKLLGVRGVERAATGQSYLIRRKTLRQGTDPPRAPPARQRRDPALRRGRHRAGVPAPRGRLGRSGNASHPGPR